MARGAACGSYVHVIFEYMNLTRMSVDANNLENSLSKWQEKVETFGGQKMCALEYHEGSLW